MNGCSMYKPRECPPVGSTVIASWPHTGHRLTVVRVEPWAVALTDTLTRDDATGRLCWYAAHCLKVVT